MPFTSWIVPPDYNLDAMPSGCKAPMPAGIYWSAESLHWVVVKPGPSPRDWYTVKADLVNVPPPAYPLHCPAVGWVLCHGMTKDEAKRIMSVPEPATPPT